MSQDGHINQDKLTNAYKVMEQESIMRKMEVYTLVITRMAI